MPYNSPSWQIKHHHPQGGHLLNLLNTRLNCCLTESEILSIFSDICAAVAHMHYHPKGPLIHRDIKVENILIADDGTYKLCDFGSTTNITVPSGDCGITVQEIRKLEMDVERYTTMQYRAPELCDLYQRCGVSEKVDVWVSFIVLIVCL